jgi:hypothetical protein
VLGVETLGQAARGCPDAVADLQLGFTPGLGLAITRIAGAKRVAAPIGVVDPAAPFEPIGAAPTVEDVIAPAPGEPVVLAPAVEDVVAPVALEVVLAALAEKEVVTRLPNQAVAATATVELIIARTTGQLVVSLEPADQVVATGPVDRVTPNAAHDHVVALGSREGPGNHEIGLDTKAGVGGGTCGIPNHGRQGCGQRHGDGQRGPARFAHPFGLLMG